MIIFFHDSTVATVQLYGTTSCAFAAQERPHWQLSEPSLYTTPTSDFTSSAAAIAVTSIAAISTAAAWRAMLDGGPPWPVFLCALIAFK